MQSIQKKKKKKEMKKKKKKEASRSPCLRASQNSIPKPKQIQHV